jgi:hypothetical protein
MEVGMPAGKRRSGTGDGARPPNQPASERELIVVANPEARFKVGALGVEAAGEADAAGLNDFLSAEQIGLEPLFGPSEERVRVEARTLGAAAAALPDLSTYYRVRAEDNRLDELASSLASLPGITGAYVKPPASPATRALDVEEQSESQPTETPPVTPDFTSRQGYLGPAPHGVDAVHAATIPGGRGGGVNIIDIEGAWNFSHEDLAQNHGGVVGGTPTSDAAWRNHGTAVVGEFGADANSFGVVGISPDAHVRAISIFGGLGSAAAIHQAATLLNPGDVILIELHRPGPRFNYQVRADQRGYIALEWWPDDLAAIRFATGKGVIVVEAAGNGAENLDDALYEAPATGFPSDWKNPFNPANPTSMAVLVGAGAPPEGTHGRNHGPDRSRLDFSNHGRRLDAQAWGREVTTTGGRGYDPGDLQGGAENVWYTDTFSGTSSASPIVVGSIACIQGILMAAGKQRLTPSQVIDILRQTGSSQQDGPNGPASQRIGNRPDIRAAVAKLTEAAVESGVAGQFWDEELAYPPGTPASLWLHVNGSWRKREGAAGHERAMVQRAFATAATEVLVWYQAAQIVGLVVRST